MKSAVETLSPTRVRLTVEVPFEELTPSVNAAYQRISQQVQLPGFRKGKVPRSLIDQRIGRGAVLDEAVNAHLPEAYSQAVRENEVVPVGQPEVDITEFADGSDLRFTAEVDVRPTIELPDYRGLKVEVSDAVVTDEQVDEQVEGLRARFATLTPVERAAQAGDFLSIDLSAARDGELLDDATMSNLSYEVGSANLIDGLDEAVTGLEAGASSTFTAPLRAGVRAGEDADVTVTVKAVRERELPALDDDFAQLASEFDTLEELRTDLRDRLGKIRLLEQGVEARDKVMERLLELVDVPLPESLVNAQVDSHFEDGHGDEAHRDEVRDETRKQLTAQFVLDEIARREELEAGQDELTEWLVRQAPRYGMSPDAFAKALVDAGQVPAAIGEVVRAKALALVLDNAEVVDASGHVVDLEGLGRSAATVVEDEEIDLPPDEADAAAQE
ncbi:MAG TPA: trigger factor [Actinomycetes bacterium]|nr:trigger factor [Actinomycetes bacterium]